MVSSNIVLNCIILEHNLSELDDRHPAASRDRKDTDNLDVVLSDSVMPYSPPGMGSFTNLHAILKEKKLGQ